MNVSIYSSICFIVCLTKDISLCYDQTILDCWYVGGGRPELPTTKGPGLTVVQTWSRGPPNWWQLIPDIALQ